MTSMLILSLQIYLCIFSAFASNDYTSSKVELDTVVIGGSRIKTEKQPTSQIYSESIPPALLSSRPSLDSAFEAHSSVQVMPTPLRGSTLSLNGLDGEHVAVFSNEDPILGRIDGALDIRSIGLEGVETISIYQGLDSLPYGSQNIAGTVALDSPWNVDENKIVASGGGGSFGKSLFSGKVSGRSKLFSSSSNTDYTLGVANWKRNAIRLNADSIDTTIDSYAKLSGHASVIQKDVAIVGGEPIDFRVGTNVFKENLKGVFNAELSNTDQNRTQVFSDFKRKDSILHASFSKFDRNADGFGANAYSEQSVRVGPELNERFGNTTVLAGSVFDMRETKSTRIATLQNGDDTVTRNNVGSFIGVRHAITDHWIAGVGTRHDSDPGILSPRAEIRYLFQTGKTDHQIWAEAGRGFREATAKEQFIDFQNPAVGYRIVGNPVLKAEKSFSTAIRYQVETGKLKWKAAVERFTFSDAIGYEAKNPGAQDGVLTYDNIGRTSTTVASIGGEYQLSYLKNILGPYWSFRTDYQWLTGENLDSREKLFLQPEHRVSFALTRIPKKGFSTSLQATYSSKQGFFDLNRNLRIDANEWNPPFWLAAVEAGYRFSVKPQFRVFARLENAFNLTRESAFPNEPRSFFVGMGAEL